MEGKLILNVKVDITDGVVKLQHAAGEIVMIPFKGTVTGEIFNGIVEPCGVDTQVVNAAGVRHMSARYMLTGKDQDGEDAHIYIENNGWFENGGGPGPFTQCLHLSLTANALRLTCTAITSWARAEWRRMVCISSFMISQTVNAAQAARGAMSYVVLLSNMPYAIN